MLNTLSLNRTPSLVNNRSEKNLINQAITHSMIKADDALNRAHFSDAHKFYKYALQLSEMQFGKQDSVVNNLRSLLDALDDLLGHGSKAARPVCENK